MYTSFLIIFQDPLTLILFTNRVKILINVQTRSISCVFSFYFSNTTLGLLIARSLLILIQPAFCFRMMKNDTLIEK
ncbi:hypothetical protein V1477_021319 [Vespula maculifrons]|uniref:Uncharacterized protein n=1 Tax=Vespula maculifrons TaxID=7453 RepID=A0ABD2AJI9_VESMC